MENNELNNRILRNVRSKIVVSNLESEENMKINAKKQILSICAVALVMVSGGFFTVNAATNGQLAKDIKEFVTVTLVKEDGSNQKLEGKTTVDENGNTWLEYEEEGKGWEFRMNVDKLELEKNYLGIDATLTEKNRTDEIEEVILEIKGKENNQ